MDLHQQVSKSLKQMPAAALKPIEYCLRSQSHAHANDQHDDGESDQMTL
jgi:hypothetical protein